MTVIITVLCIMIIGLLDKVLNRLDEIEKQLKQYEHDDGR